MNRISEDVSKVRMYLGPAVMYGLTLVTMMFLTVGVMLRIDVTLTLCSLAPLPLMSFGVYKISARIHRKSDAVQSAAEPPQRQGPAGLFWHPHLGGSPA